MAWSEERKKNFSEKYRGKNHPLYGKRMSDEARAKLKAAAKNRLPVSNETKKRLSEYQRRNHAIPVICYETGEWFETIDDAAQFYNVWHGNISMAVKFFPDKTCAGYHWYREGTDVSNVQIPEPVHQSQPVVCIETKQHFKSLREASLRTGYDIRHISRACQEPTRTAGR